MMARHVGTLAFEVPWKSLLDELRNLFDLELSAVEAWESKICRFLEVFFDHLLPSLFAYSYSIHLDLSIYIVYIYV